MKSCVKHGTFQKTTQEIFQNLCNPGWGWIRSVCSTVHEDLTSKADKFCIWMKKSNFEGKNLPQFIMKEIKELVKKYLYIKWKETRNLNRSVFRKEEGLSSITKNRVIFMEDGVSLLLLFQTSSNLLWRTAVPSGGETFHFSWPI